MLKAARLSNLAALAALAVLFGATFTVSSLAQSPVGDITGVITDEQGRGVAEVYVTAHGDDQSERVQTGADGQFRIHDLGAGRYVVTAARDGYATAVRNGVVVRMGKTVTVPLTMKEASPEPQPQTAPRTLTARFRGLNPTNTADGTLPSYNPIAGLPPSSFVVAGLGGLQNSR